MDPDPKVTELLDELTEIEITKLRQFLHLPLELNEELSNGMDLISTLKTSKEHRPFRFYKALLAIRPELVPSATEIPWLCDEADDNKYELDYETDLLSMKTVIRFLKTKIPKDKWVIIYISIMNKAIANMSFAVTMKMLFEKGYIKMTFLADIIEQVEGKEVGNKLRQMDIYFMTIEEDKFKKLFKDAIQVQSSNQVMSHGNEKEELIFSDDKPLSKEKIVRELSSKYCKDLDEKPKIFLFQACRGTLEENPAGEHRVTNYSVNSPKTSTIINNCKDIFITDSTIKHYVSYRCKENGSYFIQSFCSVMEYCNEFEFLHIMLEVRRRVMLISESDMQHQCTEDENRLSKQV